MHFTIWLTKECNLQCTYCYEGKNKQHSIMSIEKAKEVTDFIYRQIIIEETNHDYVSIDFLGGEPLLNFDVMLYIIETVRSWELPVPIFMSTTTNAVLLTKEKSTCLMSRLDEISVSIDGKEQTHDLHRKFPDGSGSFQSMIANIQELLSYTDKSCKLRARMTVGPDTAKWLYENVIFLINLGFQTVVPVMDRFVDWSEKEADCLYQEMVKIYEKIAVKRKDLLIGLVDDITLRQESFCLAGEVTMHISPDGTIFPCSYVMGLDDFVFGDVRRGILAEKVEWLRNINNDKMDDSCIACAWKRLCTGNRCRLLNYAATGDFFTPSAATCLNERLQLKLCREFYSSERKKQ